MCSFLHRATERWRSGASVRQALSCGVVALTALTIAAPARAQDSATSAGADAAPSEQAADAPPAPEIVPPKMVHYEPPKFPAEAEAAGTEASVQLQFTVNVDGTTSDPEVVTPVGSGFDEAALEASKGLRFTPALVNGEPTAVRIGFQYNFTLEEEEVVEEEAPTTGELSGILLISGPDDPLPGVEVRLVDEYGAGFSTTTDGEGRWSFPELQPGQYKLEITFEGFLPVNSEEAVVAGEAAEVTFRISPEPTEFEVVVEGERPPREVTRRTLERREVNRIPGSNGDALRSIQSLPGVARPPGLAGLLIVRGSAPGDTETFVDGTNVPQIYHFGGLSSVIPTEMIERLDFYPGNFSVRYGRQQGGIVDVGLRTPNTDCYADYGEVTGEKGCFHGMAQIDNINGRLMASGPLGGDWSFAVAGRRSWIETWLKPILEQTGTSVTSAPVYYDYQAIVDRNVGPDDRLSFRFYGSDDKFESIITDPAATDPGFGGSLRFGTSFLRGQVVYQKQLSKVVNVDSQLSVGTDSIDFQLGTNAFTLDSIPILLRSEFGFKVHRTAKVNVGMDLLASEFEVFVRFPPPPRPGETAGGPLATAVQRESSAKGFAFRPGLYTDVEWQPSTRWRVVPGVRLDYGLDYDGPDFSPRVNARYSLFLPEDNHWDGRKTVLKGGVGKYSQPPQFQETDSVFGSPGLQSNVSWHYSLGIEQDLTDQIEISMEGFYKDLEHQVTRAANDSGVFAYDNVGTGQVIGLETLIRYNPDERFFGWIAYTLSESLRQDCPTCPERLFQYDQTHNLILLGSYRLGAGWEVGARFRIVTGPLVTPTIGDPLPAVYEGDGGTYVPIQGDPFSERLPLFHQADMRVDKRWTFKTWRLSAYLDVQNVYNNMAVEGVTYNYNFSQQANQTGLPILPSLGVRGEF